MSSIQTYKERRNETLKKRYQVYRKLGYDSKTSSALSQRSLDVSQLEISKKTGKIKQNNVTKQYIEVTLKEWKRDKAIDNYNDKMDGIKNDTAFTRHGMLTHDKRYKGETGRAITILKKQHNLSNDQAYYFYYFMVRNRLSYKDAKKQLLTNQSFQEYDKLKRQRLNGIKNVKKDKGYNISFKDAKEKGFR